MNESELRTGVSVYQVREWGQPIDKKVIQWDASIWYRIGECLQYMEDFEPIPLTEDVLVRCGFVNGRLNNFRFIHETDLTIDGYEHDYNGLYIGRIEYLHQLQNLYFALTGQELIYEFK